MAKKKRITTDIGLNLLKIYPTPKNDEQTKLLETIKENQITFVYGPPGCGKSFIASLFGIFELLNNKYSRMIITRPCVEANGEKLGYLPGSLDQKLLPYVFPVFDILNERVDTEVIKNLVKDNIIQTIPIAFLRGTTFKRSFVLVDEAQNTTIEQMRLILTRIGEHSKFVITGDIKQSDIYRINGLKDAIHRFKGAEKMAICELTENSIFRSPLIAEIERRYEKKNL